MRKLFFLFSDYILIYKRTAPFGAVLVLYVRLSLPPMGFAGELYNQLVNVHLVDALGDDLIAELEHGVECQLALGGCQLNDVRIFHA